MKRELEITVSALAFSSVLIGCGSTTEQRASTSLPEASVSSANVATTSLATTSQSSEPLADVTTVDTEDLVVGTGATAEIGRRVRMRYVGRLLDGTEFDRTLRRPFEFQLGAHEVIQGWDQGIPGMRVGGKRKIVIPAALAYGAQGAPPAVPPNATLVFEVELIDVL